MATEGWRHATKETAISAAVILTSDVVLQHLDGRLNIATDRAAVRYALKHWAASRPGRVFTSALRKGGFDIPTGTSASLTLDKQVLALLKAHGLDDRAVMMPSSQGMRGVQGTGHSFDVMLGNGKRMTLRMKLPNSSGRNPSSSVIVTYLKDGVDAVRTFTYDAWMSVYAILVGGGEFGYNILAQRVLNAGVLEQILMGSVVIVGVVVGGTYLVRAIRPLTPAFNKSEAIMPVIDDKDHEAKLNSDEDRGSGPDNRQSWQTAVDDESHVESIEEGIAGEDVEQEQSMDLKYMEALRSLMETSSALEILQSENEQQKELLAVKARELEEAKVFQGIVKEEDEQELNTMEEKYMEALQWLVETSSAFETLKSETEQQKEMLATIDRELEEVKVIQGLLDAKACTIRLLQSEASTAEKTLCARDQEIIGLKNANTTLESTADQQKTLIANFNTRAEERTKTIRNLSMRISEAESEKKLLNTDITRISSDIKIQDTTIRSLRSSQREHEQKISELKKRNSALEEDTKKSKELVEECETTIKDLEAEVLGFINTTKDLETQIDDDAVAFDKKVDDIDRLTTENETLKAENTRLLESNEQLTKAGDSFAASATESQKTIDALRSDSPKPDGQIKNLETRNDDLQKALSEAKGIVKTLQDTNVSLKEEVAEGKQECRGLLEKCDEEEAESKAKDGKVQQLKKAYKDNLKTSTAKDDKINELKKLCKYLKGVNAEADDANQSLQQELDDVRADLKKSWRDNEGLMAQLEDREEAKSDDGEWEEEEKEKKEEKEEDKDDGGKGNRDEAHGEAEGEQEEDGSDKEYEDAFDRALAEGKAAYESDEEYEDASDEPSADSSGKEADQGIEADHHREGHEDVGDVVGEGNIEGGDALDGNASKKDQEDNIPASEGSPTPTTVQEAPQQPLSANGLSNTVCSPSVDPAHAAPEDESLPGTPESDGSSDCVRSPPVDPGAPANNALSEILPIVQPSGKDELNDAIHLPEISPTVRPLTTDGLSDTIRSPKIDADPVNNEFLQVPSAIQPSATDGLNDTIRSPSVDPAYAAMMDESLPGTPESDGSSDFVRSPPVEEVPPTMQPLSSEKLSEILRALSVNPLPAAPTNNEIDGSNATTRSPAHAGPENTNLPGLAPATQSLPTTDASRNTMHLPGLSPIVRPRAADRVMYTPPAKRNPLGLAQTIRAPTTDGSSATTRSPSANPIHEGPARNKQPGTKSAAQSATTRGLSATRRSPPANPVPTAPLYNPIPQTPTAPQPPKSNPSTKTLYLPGLSPSTTLLPPDQSRAPTPSPSKIPISTAPAPAPNKNTINLPGPSSATSTPPFPFPQQPRIPQQEPMESTSAAPAPTFPSRMIRPMRARKAAVAAGAEGSVKEGGVEK